mgnify:CR=1 FL=1
MKNRKICPKCNSTDIIKVPGKAGAYGVGNNIQTDGAISPLCLSTGMFAAPAATLRNGSTKRIFPD